MTWMGSKEKMVTAVLTAKMSKMLSGSRLILSQDIHDEDQVHIYEPFKSSGNVMFVGTILKDVLSDDISRAVSENTAAVIEINLIGIATNDTRTRGQE